MGQDGGSGEKHNLCCTSGRPTEGIPWQLAEFSMEEHVQCRFARRISRFVVAVAAMTARLNESCVREALTQIMGWKKEDSKPAAQRFVAAFVHCQQKQNSKNRGQATRC